MRRIAFLAAALALGWTTLAEEAAKPAVGDLAWIRGSWSCAKWGGTFEEHWTPATGGTLGAVGRLVADGKTKFMEFISIETGADGRPTMYVLPGALSKQQGRKPTAFPLKTLAKDEVVFANPEHDFPQSITYRRKGADALEVELVGEEKGAKRTEHFAYRRMR